MFHTISEQLKKGGDISPFLFIGENLEILHHEIELYIGSLFHEYHMDMQSLFRLIDTGESLKIEEVKKFISQGDVKPRFRFQIFFIENISRMTDHAQNACLKFLEEAGEGNIVFITNTSESGILETILSRVQILRSLSQKEHTPSDFFLSLIRSHISGKSQELIRYFFAGKIEKEEYIDFLKTLLIFCIQTGQFIEYIDELQEDISGILHNNLQGKYIVDKYIIRLKHKKG